MTLLNLKWHWVVASLELSWVDRILSYFLPVPSYFECNRPSCVIQVWFEPTILALYVLLTRSIDFRTMMRRMRVRVSVILPIWLGLVDIEEVRFRTQNLLIVHCLSGLERGATPGILTPISGIFDIGDLETWIVFCHFEWLNLSRFARLRMRRSFSVVWVADLFTFLRAWIRDATVEEVRFRVQGSGLVGVSWG